MAQLGSVLVIRLSSLGDVLFAVPAVQELLRSGLAERVSWLVEDRAAGLVRRVPGLDQVVVFPRRSPAAWPGHVRRLRARRDDLVLDFQGNLKSRAQRACLTAPRKLGFDRPLAREGAWRGLTEALLPPRSARHRVASNLALLAPLGIRPPSPPPRPQLALPDEAHAEARRLAADLDGGGPLVVLHPGTSGFGALKRWDPERFAALGEALRREHDARVAVSAGPGEEPLADAVVRGMPSRGSVVRPGSLDGLAALLGAADLVVAADSLPLHLANATGTPVVGLYGPKDPAVTGPAWDRSRVVRSGVACSPCSLRRCADRLCMRRLTTDAVLAAARELLAP